MYKPFSHAHYLVSITKERTEVIFQGTYDMPNDPNAKWEEYEFKCKPGISDNLRIKICHFVYYIVKTK